MGCKYEQMLLLMYVYNWMERVHACVFHLQWLQPPGVVCMCETNTTDRAFILQDGGHLPEVSRMRWWNWFKGRVRVSFFKKNVLPQSKQNEKNFPTQWDREKAGKGLEWKFFSLVSYLPGVLFNVGKQSKLEFISPWNGAIQSIASSPSLFSCLCVCRAVA